MPRIVALILVLLLISPGLAGAQERILESAERLAAETTLQTPPEFRRSPGRTAVGIAMAAAGAVMMLIDPEQPTQPTTISNEMLVDDSVAGLANLTALDVIALRRTVGTTVLVCEPFCIGDIDEAILGSFATGAASGLAAATTVIDDNGWQLYQGQFQPFKERNKGLKFGGAALAVAGAAITALWSSVPVARDIRVAPTPGGFAVGSGFGF